MSDVRTIRVFIASPGDLAVERAAFKKVVDELNDGFAAGAGVKFVPLGWEDTLSEVGRRPQDEINKDVDRCDVFMLALHRRWGAKAADIPKPATSRTEEEYLRAFGRWKNTESPRIFVFFKKINADLLVDPGQELKKVLAFKRKLEKSGIVLYRNFDDEPAFRSEIKKHLQAVAKPDEPPPVAAPLTPVDMPPDRIKELEKALADSEKRTKRAEAVIKRLQARQSSGKKKRPAPRKAIEELALARADELALALAESASKAALEGRVEEARQDFAKATDGTTNLDVLFLAFEFYERTGDLATAEELLERWLALSGRDAETADTAIAQCNLGLIYSTRGELDLAEEMHLKSLAIEEKLGRQEGIARQYGNLGVIYYQRGELDRAEETFHKGLVIEEKFGLKAGLAAKYSNLGLIYRTRGELDRAEEMHQKSLAIREKLGLQEGMASQYGNLGLIYRLRGELDRAEEMFHKVLAIDEKLGRQQSIAIAYSNLGSVAKDRSDLERTRVLWTKALDLYAKIGIPHMVKQMQGLLDGLPKPGAQSKRASGGHGKGQGKKRKT